MNCQAYLKDGKFICGSVVRRHRFMLYRRSSTTANPMMVLRGYSSVRPICPDFPATWGNTRSRRINRPRMKGPTGLFQPVRHFPGASHFRPCPAPILWEKYHNHHEALSALAPSRFSSGWGSSHTARGLRTWYSDLFSCQGA